MEKFTGIKQFDFQIIRFTERFKHSEMVKNDLKQIGRYIKDFKTWKIWWKERAEFYESKGYFDIAARYYRASFFYIFGKSEEKDYLYNKFSLNFYKSYKDFEYEKHFIPYENSSLPSLFLKNKKASKTLLVTNGFDGILEEIADFISYMKDTNYNIIIFDGPGQGLTYLDGLKLIPNYELVVSKVLDYYNLKEVDILGLSMGGYFAMRSAAFEKRINKVVAMDIFYNSLDAFKMSIGTIPYLFFNLLLKLKAKKMINKIVDIVARLDLGTAWQINNALQVSGENNAFDMIENIKRHNIKHCLPLINQDCLLLAAKNDMYVPYKRLKTIEKGLKNSKYVESILFTKKTGGELHCHIGNMELAFNKIKVFLS